MSSVTRDDLNAAQYEAVTWNEGPVLVIAGAGSGKTRTLVYRVAYLIEKGVKPENILLLTFTRKSSQEMLHRAASILHFSCNHVMGGTYHAVANILLRRHGSLLDYPPRFTIIDRADAEDIVKLLKNSLELGVKDKQFPSKRVIVNAISMSVNKAFPLQHVIEEQYEHLEEYVDDFLKIYEHYRTFKHEHGLMDYDDLLVNWLRLLREHEPVRRELAEKYQYILVDEYQDSNPIQAAIVKSLAGPEGNVMAVGDDSQSIYSFRGADFRNIMEFPKIFPGAAVIRLEENYRSTGNILGVANKIIDNATEKYTKILFTKNEDGERPIVYAARDERDQSSFIVKKIKEMIRNGHPTSEIAVLFRAGYQSFKLEIDLTSAGINFEKRGGLKLTESAHIKDVLAYLRIVTNDQDYLSWNRVLLHFPKVGAKTAEKITAFMRSRENSISGLREYARGKSWEKNAEQLCDVIEKAKGDKEPSAAMSAVLDYYDEIFRMIYHDDYPRRQRDLDQLRNVISDYEKLQSFLDDTALDPPEAPRDENHAAISGEMDRIVLSTVHSAKGLEWNTVFMIHLVEGKFPMGNALMADQQEEERRLFYVAVTRAKRQLFMIHPRYLSGFDRQSYPTEISPFLREIPHSQVKMATSSPSFLDPFLEPFNKSPEAKPSRKRPQRKHKALKNSEGLQKGDRVRHAFFGEGVILNIVNPHTVEVDFSGHGRKTLHLNYAKLEVL